MYWSHVEKGEELILNLISSEIQLEFLSFVCLYYYLLLLSWYIDV